VAFFAGAEGEPRNDDLTMSTISVEEAQARLSVLISELKPGEELLITERDQPVARLIAESSKVRKPRQPGSAIGTLTIIKDDDAHLDDFKEYMP